MKFVEDFGRKKDVWLIPTKTKRWDGKTVTALWDATWGDFHPYMCTNTILPTGDVSTHKSRIGQVSARSIYNKLVKANKLVGNKRRKKNDVCTAVGQ
jgi:hypothetical protein